jgi:hypothetical protein
MFTLLTATSLCAQEKPNTFRRVEINWNIASVAHLEEATAWGGQLGIGLNLTPTIAIVGDFDGHRFNELGTSVDLFTYRVGPRFYSHHGDRVRAFGHVLLGGGRFETSDSVGGVTTTLSVNGFAMAAGGGVDVGIKPWLAIRAGQFDYNYTRFEGMTLDGFRFGAGVVFRLGKKS